MVIDLVPSVEMVRFVSSGTEACLSVLRLMRAYTGREKIIKFTGCYHGHADSFLVKAGSGVITLGLPDSPGVPKSTAAATLTATYNNIESVKELFAANKGEISGVIIEPVVGNSGFIVPTKEFLQGLRDVCTAEGALLCFDEVMTGFRIAKVGGFGRGLSFRRCKGYVMDVTSRTDPPAWCLDSLATGAATRYWVAPCFLTDLVVKKTSTLQIF